MLFFFGWQNVFLFPLNISWSLWAVSTTYCRWQKSQVIKYTRLDEWLLREVIPGGTVQTYFFLITELVASLGWKPALNLYLNELHFTLNSAISQCYSRFIRPFFGPVISFNLALISIILHCIIFFWFRT